MNGSILKNTFALFLTNLLNPVVSFLLVLVISRYLGVEGLGQYSLVMSYVAIFGAIASLGLGSLLVREVAKSPESLHALFSNAVLFGTVASLLTLLAMNAVVASMGYEREVVEASFILSLSLVVSTPAYFVESIFRSVEKSEYIAVTGFVENTIKVALCVLLAVLGYGIVAICVVILVTRVFALGLFLYFYVKVLGRPAWGFRPDIWLFLAREAPFFAGIVIFSTIHLSVDQIILSKLKSIEAVGIYSASDRLLSICKTFPLAFSSALLPFFTKEFSAGTAQLRDLAVSSSRYTFLLALPVVVGTAILSDQIISLIYGQKFSASGRLLTVQIFSLIPFGLAYIFAAVLIATGNQKVDMAINMVAAVSNIALNFILISWLAEMGAVLATLTTIVIFHQLQVRYVRKHLFAISFPPLMYKALFATAIMGAVTFLLRDLHVLINVAVSAGVYCAAALAMKALSPEEIRFLRGLLPTASRTR
jgi:O-antigen/teichoic acid export membrane protein